MVPEAGLEPAHHCWREILNLLCLPISPLWHCLDFTIFPWDTKSLENFESVVSTNSTTPAQRDSLNKPGSFSSDRKDLRSETQAGDYSSDLAGVN